MGLAASRPLRGHLRAPEPADAEHTTASNAVINVAFAVLTGYNLARDDAVDAVRALRATLHGFITLEQAGGFGLPADVERSFDRLVAGLSMTLSTWALPSASDPA